MMTTNDPDMAIVANFSVFSQFLWLTRTFVAHAMQHLNNLHESKFDFECLAPCSCSLFDFRFGKLAE